MKFNHSLFKVFILCFCLPSCQLVQGEESAFVSKSDWDYGANVAPQALLAQFRKENIDQEWIGDPQRFRVLKIQALGQKTLYFVYPFIDCPENGCVTLQLRQLYQPLCNASGGCGYFVYAEENGKYRQVFNEVIWKQVDESRFVQVSTIPFQGLPSCFKLGGFDGARRESIKKINGVIVSQYCYNGREYVFDNYQTVPLEKPNQSEIMLPTFSSEPLRLERSTVVVTDLNSPSAEKDSGYLSHRISV